jgi:hypothetical protein
VRAVDWGQVRWELEELSGIALRHVRVDRGYQHALDEARDRATQFGIVDERPEVVDHWRDAKSWIAPPVMVAGDLLGGGSGLELLVGYTRLGNLLGMLDRQEVSGSRSIWCGWEEGPLRQATPNAAQVGRSATNRSQGLAAKQLRLRS